MELIARLAIITGKPTREPGGAMGDAGFGRIGSRLDVVEEGFGVSPHLWQVASHGTAGPQPIVDRQSFGRVLVAKRPLAGSREGLGRFRRTNAARCDQRVAVGDVQSLVLLTSRRIRLDLVRLHQRRQQRLRLGDFRHFWRRREAFERWREDGMGLNGAGGRLVEPGERKRRAQFEAARALLLGDGDGGQGSFFCRRGIPGVAFEQDFATNAVELHFKCAMISPLGLRQRGFGAWIR